MIRHRTGGTTTFSLTFNRRQKHYVKAGGLILVILALLAVAVNYNSGKAFDMSSGASSGKHQDCNSLNQRRYNGTASEEDLQEFETYCSYLIDVQTGR